MSVRPVAPRQNTPTLVEIEKLSLKLKGRTLIDDFSLCANAGERIGITGPSGCGKTTLLRSIVARQLPTGSSATRFRVEKLRTGYVPQTGGLLPWYSVSNNVRVFSTARLGQCDCEEILEQGDIKTVAHSLPRQLSRGELQRTRLACAVASEPGLFCVDEPLTEIGIEQKWDLFRWCSAEIARLNSVLILMSHDLDTLLYFCDRILLLRRPPGSPARVTFEHRVEVPHPRCVEDLGTKLLLDMRSEMTKQLIKPI
jgi:ABC-type multidrug transport system ATPase subunit